MRDGRLNDCYLQIKKLKHGAMKRKKYYTEVTRMKLNELKTSQNVKNLLSKIENQAIEHKEETSKLQAQLNKMKLEEQVLANGVEKILSMVDEKITGPTAEECSLPDEKIISEPHERNTELMINVLQLKVEAMDAMHKENKTNLKEETNQMKLKVESLLLKIDEMGAEHLEEKKALQTEINEHKENKLLAVNCALSETTEHKEEAGKLQAQLNKMKLDEQALTNGVESLLCMVDEKVTEITEGECSLPIEKSIRKKQTRDKEQMINDIQHKVEKMDAMHKANKKNLKEEINQMKLNVRNDSGTCITEPASGNTFPAMATKPKPVGKVGTGCGLLSWFSREADDSYFSTSTINTAEFEYLMSSISLDARDATQKTVRGTDTIQDSVEITHVGGRGSSM